MKVNRSFSVCGKWSSQIILVRKTFSRLTSRECCDDMSEKKTPLYICLISEQSDKAQELKSIIALFDLPIDSNILFHITFDFPIYGWILVCICMLLLYRITAICIQQADIYQYHLNLMRLVRALVQICSRTDFTRTIFLVAGMTISYGSGRSLNG